MADAAVKPGGSKRYNCIIIGGGVSGLSSARLLTAAGLNIIVLEARDRVGGRTWTSRDPSYKYTDLGGAYIGPTQRRVARLAKELDLEFYKVNEKEKTIMTLRGKTMTYYGTIPNILHPIKAMDLNNVMQKLDRMAAEVPPDAPWKAPKAKEWDAMTFQNFIDQTCWTDLARESSILVCRAVVCSEPHEVSLLFMLWYIISGQGTRRLLSVTNGAQERKFVGGAQQLSERMADQLSGRVHLNKPVIRVEQNDSGVKVTTSDFQVYEGDYLISGMPQTLLNRVTFVPPLPPKRLQMIQRIPMGSIIKTMTFYSKAFWKDRNLNGQMIIDTGPILYCVDDTKPDGTVPCIMGFILADRARDLVRLSVEERKQEIAKHYAKAFKCDDFLHPVNYIEKNWMEEEYSGGCYVSAMPPGVLTQYGHVLREPYKKIFFAGTESATVWVGYIEGAIQAGERAAREVLHQCGKISANEIWQDEDPVAYFPEPPVKQHPAENVLPSVGSFLWFCAAVTAGVAGWALHRFLDISVNITPK